MNKYRALFAFLVLAITVALAGCATPGDATPAATAPAEATAVTTGAATAAATAGATTAPADSLANTTWQLEEYGPANDLQPALATATPTLNFSGDGQASGFAGCNSFNAPYTIEGDNISFGLIISTMMACRDRDVSQEEEDYLAAIRTTGRFEQTADSLTIFYDDGQRELHFVPMAPGNEATAAATTAPAGGLANTMWQLEEYGLTNELQPALATATPTLNFSGDGQASGFAGCNSFNAPYTIEGDNISFGLIMSSMMDCRDRDVSQQEEDFLAAIRTTGRFEQTADSLTIFYDDGQRELHFVPMAPGNEATSMPGTTLGPLQQIEMIDATHGWAIGMGTGSTPAAVLWTEDGGQTWHDRTPAQTAPGGVPGNAGPAASFASADAGWISYGGAAPATNSDTFVVWRTEDGGQNWTASEPLPVANMTMEFFQPSDLVVNEDGFGWMLAHLGVGMSHDYIAVYTTTDSGVTWQRVSDPDSAPDIQACPKSALRFTSAADGWLAANCPGLMPPLPFYHSTDGGATWQQVTLPAPDAQTVPADSLGDQCGIPQMALVAPDTLALTLRCVDFQQSNSAQAWLYTSDNGGQSWQTAALPVGTLTFDFLDANEGWLLGGADDQPGTTQQLYHSGDGGQTWQSLATVAAPGTPDFVDATYGWIVTKDGALLRSSDGGATWETVAATLAP